MGFTRRRPDLSRRFVIDVMKLGARKHVIHGLVEVDVSRARTLMAASESDLSFTAFVAASLGRAIARHPIVHACRDWRGELVLFDEVDVCVIVESERSDRSFPMPVVLRSTESRSVAELTADIRHAQAHAHPPGKTRGERFFGYMPGPLRRTFTRLALRNPAFLKKTTGTAAVTSVGMFGDSSGFGIAFPTVYTMGLVVGSITERVVMEDGRPVGREHLNLTLSFDHDIVDGGPAARFSADLVAALKNAAVLGELAAEGEARVAR